MTGPKTLFLLSGLLCDETLWDEVRDRIGGRLRIYAVAFPDYDAIPAMAEAVLARAPGEPFALVGHSMGGRVALEIVARQPNRVAKLALLNTGVHPRRAGEAEKRKELVDLAYTAGMAAVADRWLPPMLAPTHQDDQAVIEPLVAMIRRQTPDSFAAQIQALVNRPDAEAGLARITCPTMLLSGRQDSWSPISQHESMAHQIPGSQLIEVEDSGHMSIAEQPAAVAAALRNWLGDWK